MRFQRFCNGEFNPSERERFGQLKKFGDEKLDKLQENYPTQTEKELAHALEFTQQAIISHRY